MHPSALRVRMPSTLGGRVRPEKLHVEGTAQTSDNNPGNYCPNESFMPSILRHAGFAGFADSRSDC